MFSALTRFFNAEEGDSQEISQRRLHVATCVLLLEAAHADDEFSPQEKASLDRIVGERFHLNATDTAELLSEADQARKDGGDLYAFSRLVNEHYEKPRKLAILELLWEVVYCDGVLEAHEDALMHKLGTVLSVRHEELMALKVRVRKKLGLS